MKSRRDALRTLAAGALVPALHGQHQHSEPLVEISKSQAPKFISGDDFKLLSQVVDVIIPRTDTPGASDAGVPFYIDRVAAKRLPGAQGLREGLAGLRTRGFEQASADQRIEILKRMETAGDPFFKQIKDLTIDGYYSSKDGLVKELGYHGNTYLKEFPGCTHPEHMAAGDGHAD